MHILILQSTLRSLACASFTDERDDPIAESSFASDSLDQSASRFPDGVLGQVRDFIQQVGLQPPDIIGVRVLVGGERFPRPVFATNEVLKDLEVLVPQAPLHLPGLIELVKSLGCVYPGIPVALVFETSFFANLPARERWYGLDPEMMETRALWRCGFHGVFHDAACLEAARQLGSRYPRVLSVCLEPRPELAACVDRRPVMVTGGNTPIEGLPGERSCGDVDPSVVLKLAYDTRWGPEEASRILTQESGLRGLTERSVSLADVLQSSDDDLQLAKQVFLHSVLRACGAGVAAMGGLDAIAYSGRYAKSGAVLHAWLSQRLARATLGHIPHFMHTRTLFQHLRDMVRVMALEADACRV